MILWEDCKNDSWEYTTQRNKILLCGVLKQGGSEFAVEKPFMQQRTHGPLNIKNDKKEISNKWGIHEPPAAFQEDRIQVSLDVGEKEQREIKNSLPTEKISVPWECKKKKDRV